MGQIGEAARVQTGQHLGGVADQMLLLVGGQEVVLQTDLVVVQVLAEDQIIQLIGADEGQQGGEQSGIVFRLQTDLDIDFVLIFVLQRAEGAAVVGELLRTHTEVGVVIAGEDLRRVIRKAQCLNTGGNGRLNVFPFRVLRMAAPDGVGVVIVFHKMPRILYKICRRMSVMEIPV